MAVLAAPWMCGLWSNTGHMARCHRWPEWCWLPPLSPSPCVRCIRVRSCAGMHCLSFLLMTATLKDLTLKAARLWVVNLILRIVNLLFPSPYVMYPCAHVPACILWKYARLWAVRTHTCAHACLSLSLSLSLSLKFFSRLLVCLVVGADGLVVCYWFFFLFFFFFGGGDDGVRVAFVVVIFVVCLFVCFAMRFVEI